MKDPTKTVQDFKQRLETYIGSDKAAKRKDIYRFLLERMNENDAPAPKSICDIGCATGDLLAFLAETFPETALTGLDLEPALIDTARDRPELDGVQFIVGDALNDHAGVFDVVTCLGVLGIFDSFEQLLSNLVRQAAPGGRIFVQALLNPDDIDVHILYRDNANGLDWMRGFNIFSRTQVAAWAQKEGLSVQFYDFHMTNALPRRESLPHRAYTVDLADGTRRTTNGLCLLLPETLMELTRPM